MAVRENDPQKLQEWMVKVEQRLRQLENRRIDAGPGIAKDEATKTVGAKISDEPGNATTIGEDGGIKSTDTVTTAADHDPLLVQKFMTAGQNIGTGADTLIVWSSQASSGSWTTTTSTITIPEDGWYHCNVEWQWANNGTGNRVLHVTTNSTAVATGSSFASSKDPEDGEPTHTLSGYRFYNEGDVLRVYAFQNSGVTLGAGGPYFGDVRGRWTVVKVHDSFPPALEQSTA